jgi:hypothetical protein
MTEQPTPSPVMHLYLDETGARHPDRASVVPKHGCDWFAIVRVFIDWMAEQFRDRLSPTE